MRMCHEFVYVYRDGNLVREVARLGLQDNIPIEFDATRAGPRSISWRGDRPAELKWVEALDGSDPKNNPDTAPRDAVFAVDLSAAAGGDAEVRQIAATDLRCALRIRRLTAGFIGSSLRQSM